MLRTDVRVVEPARLIDGQLNDALGAGGQPDLTGGSTVAAPDDELHSGAHLVQLHTKVRKHLGGYAIALADEPEQQVLGTDVVVVESLGFFLRQRQHAPSSFREFVEAVSHL